MTKIEELEQKKVEIEFEIEKLKQMVDDPIYLLSIEEYKKYKGKIPKYNSLWWLRSPGTSRHLVAVVTDENEISYFGDYINCDNVCVCPVINELNMTDHDKAYFGFIDDHKMVFCGMTWLKVDDYLWIPEVPIAKRRFDDDKYKAGNNYKESEIRQFLLDWYERRKNW